MERAPLHRLDLGAALVEEQVFQFLDALVEPLHGGEVAVDEVAGALISLRSGVPA